MGRRQPGAGQLYYGQSPPGHHPLGGRPPGGGAKPGATPGDPAAQEAAGEHVVHDGRGGDGDLMGLCQLIRSGILLALHMDAPSFDFAGLILYSAACAPG